MIWGEERVLLGLTRNEFIWSLVVLEIFDSLERFLEVIIHKEASLHDFLIVYRGDFLLNFWLNFFESPVHVDYSVIEVSRLS